MPSRKQDRHLPDFALVERQEMIMGLGYTQEALDRPQIGVVSSWGEVNPASVHLDRVVGHVKAGIWAAGGTPREFVISSICTSMAGNDNYHLPHRDLVAGYIETVAKTNLFDAMVFVPVCDDVIPAHLMAAGRLDLPAVVLTGGYMQLNRHQGRPLDPLMVAPKHFSDFKAGRIGEVEFTRIKDRGCPGTGACPVMGTANTMAAMAEALGMSPPDNAATPGADSRLNRLAFYAGQQVVRLLEAGTKPSQIMTLKAFENAIRTLMAIGGSTNAVLHLQAIAAELDLSVGLTTFNELCTTTPLICDVAPSGSGRHMIGELDQAGGIQGVMKELSPLLHTEAATITGATLGQNLETAEIRDREVIRPLGDPLSADGGLLFLKGNLAPGGALIKKSAVPAGMMRFEGPARIFADEEAACEALQADRIEPGQVVVVRYVGPKGDPGMRLLQRFLWLSAARGMHEKIALITDGRFSGTNKGCAVAHISPEAAGGGPLALVQEGDPVLIDIPGRRLDLLVEEEELRRRARAWRPPKAKVGKGYLSVYSRLAHSAEQGAALDYGPGQEED